MKITQTDNQILIEQTAYSVYCLTGLTIAVGIALVGTMDASGKHVYALVGAFFVLIGSIMTAVAQSRKVTIVPGANTDIVRARLGYATQQTFPTGSIKGVRLVQSINGSQKQGTILFVLSDDSSRVVAEKNKGTGITLFGIPLSLLFTKPPLQNEAQRLADFLHVPLAQNNLTNMGGVILTPAPWTLCFLHQGETFYSVNTYV